MRTNERLCLELGPHWGVRADQGAGGVAERRRRGSGIVDILLPRTGSLLPSVALVAAPVGESLATPLIAQRAIAFLQSQHMRLAARRPLRRMLNLERE